MPPLHGASNGQSSFSAPGALDAALPPVEPTRYRLGDHVTWNGIPFRIIAFDGPADTALAERIGRNRPGYKTRIPLVHVELTQRAGNHQETPA